MKFSFKHPILKCIGISTLAITLLSCGKNDKLTLFSCENRFQAKSCNEACVVEKDFQVSFMINKEEKSVLEVMYFQGNQSSSTHKNCTIFDSKNWDCSYSDLTQGISSSRELLMANGIYTNTSEVRDLSNGVLRNAREKGYCAK
jgi:hypothetical protein